MKFTLAEIRGMQNGLMVLIKMQLPVKLSYRIAKLFNFCAEELSSIEEARIKAVKKYSKEDSNKPGEYMVDPENSEKFKNELNQLMGEEVECDFTPISVSELGDIKIAPLDLSGLSKIIIE